MNLTMIAKYEREARASYYRRLGLKTIAAVNLIPTVVYSIAIAAVNLPNF